MAYSNDQLREMSFEELCHISVQDMAEHPPIRGLGFPPYVVYKCKFCGHSIEGSERSVRDLKKAKPVTCPYCQKELWSPENGNHLRKTAYELGHFDNERKKAYLKHLKVTAARREGK